MGDLPIIIRNLSTNGQILAYFINSIPKEQLFVQRRPGLWTIAEHVQHLADVQPMLLERIQRFEADDKPRFIPFVPDEEPDQPAPRSIDIDDALQRFDHVRLQQTDLLNRIDSTAWEKSASHPEYAQYNLYILIRHILMHDHWHMYRIEELWLTRDEYLTEPG